MMDGEQCADKEFHTHTFRVAELFFELRFKKDGPNTMGLLPSLEVFRKDRPAGTPLLFRLTIDDTLQPRRKDRQRIRAFDTGNGDIVVDRYPDGGYQYIIKDLEGRECALLQGDKEFADCRCALNGTYGMRQFGLNNALMLVYAFASCRKGVLLIHASLVRHRGYGYAFIAESGTGKSTQVSNWLKYIPDCDLMNDDNPIVRIMPDGQTFIYGSPWSGKTPCYRDVKAPLGAITRIDRAKQNRIEKLRPSEAFAIMLLSCSTMKWDLDIFDAVCKNVTTLVERLGIHILHCLPDRESALVCRDALVKEENN